MENHNSGNFVMGMILAFAGSKNSLGENWLICDGSEIPEKYQELRTLLGTNNTPNLAGRTLIGTGTPNNNPQSDGTIPNFNPTSSWSISNTGGEFQHKLTTTEIPSHSHTINGGDFGIHHRSFEGENAKDHTYETHPDHNIHGTDHAGGDGFHNNMPPYFAVDYIIYAGLPNE